MIAEYMSNPTFRDWVLCFVIFVLIIWKIWPELSSRLKKTFDTARYGADLVDMVQDHQLQIYGEGGINNKLQRDFEKINRLEHKAKINTKENELIMKSMLAMLKAINKIEPSEDTAQIQDEIVDFMNRQSHVD